MRNARFVAFLTSAAVGYWIVEVSDLLLQLQTGICLWNVPILGIAIQSGFAEGLSGRVPIRAKYAGFLPVCPSATHKAGRLLAGVIDGHPYPPRNSQCWIRIAGHWAGVCAMALATCTSRNLRVSLS
jgi:hypothetical protein